MAETTLDFLKAQLNQEVYCKDYYIWKGIKGFIRWEKKVRSDRFENDIYLQVTSDKNFNRVFVNGEEYIKK